MREVKCGGTGDMGARDLGQIHLASHLRLLDGMTRMPTGPVAALFIGVTLAICLIASSVASATVLPEVIKENTTLTPANNPYTGTTTIESGATVTVEPGVRFEINRM